MNANSNEVCVRVGVPVKPHFAILGFRRGFCSDMAWLNWPWWMTDFCLQNLYSGLLAR